MSRGNVKLKYLDRIIGIPVVALLGLLKWRKNKSISSPKRIAFLNPSAIGDTVLFFGVLKDIRKKFPDCELVFFSGRQNQGVASMSDAIDKVVILPIEKPIRAIKLVRSEGHFDVFIDFMTWPRINSIIAFFSKSKVKVGFDTEGQFRHYVFDIKVKHSSEIHEFENYKLLSSAIGVVSNSLPQIPSYVVKSDQTIIFHIFPSGYMAERKCWPNNYWYELGKYFLEKGFEVGITGGPSDSLKAKEFAKRFETYSSFHNYAGILTLKETVNLLSKAKLIVTVNTGIMHLAAALGVNLISLNGPTNVKRWGPISENSISIESPHPNAPCLNHGFEYSCKNKICNCMSVIDVKSVIKKAELFFV